MLSINQGKNSPITQGNDCSKGADSWPSLFSIHDDFLNRYSKSRDLAVPVIHRHWADGGIETESAERLLVFLGNLEAEGPRTLEWLKQYKRALEQKLSSLEKSPLYCCVFRYEESRRVCAVLDAVFIAGAKRLSALYEEKRDCKSHLNDRDVVLNTWTLRGAPEGRT